VTMGRRWRTWPARREIHAYAKAWLLTLEGESGHHNRLI
jgi:hypothetical protein